MCSNYVYIQLGVCSNNELVNLPVNCTCMELLTYEYLFCGRTSIYFVSVCLEMQALYLSLIFPFEFKHDIYYVSGIGRET